MAKQDILFPAFLGPHIKTSYLVFRILQRPEERPAVNMLKVWFNVLTKYIDDLSRLVLILFRMRMQEFSAGNKNINKDAANQSER